jgi:hypothetical protein
MGLSLDDTELDALAIQAEEHKEEARDARLASCSLGKIQRTDQLGNLSPF